MGAPASVLLAMDLRIRDTARDTDYQDFGGTKAVNGIDQRVARLTKARGYPIFRIGTWKNGADLVFAMGMGVYDTFNAESPDRIIERITCSNHDYIQRGWFLRKGFETFMRAAALRDEVAFPHGTELGMQYWNSLIETKTLLPSLTEERKESSFGSDSDNDT